MELSPRYGTSPVLRLEGWPPDIAVPLARQRRRLAAILADFDDAGWANPSRCEGWTNRDVMVHLESTNGFWGYSLACARKGQPSTLLTNFDPVATPAAMVDAAGAVTGPEIGNRFAETSERLLDAVDALGPGEWELLAEAPPGHLTVSAMLHHALWDSWVHERDILEPLGRAQELHDDEIVAVLRYAAVLSPAFAVSEGHGRTGVVAVRATDPDLALRIEVGPDSAVVRPATSPEPGGAEPDTAADVVIEGDAVALLEAFSVRRPLSVALPEAHAWMVQGLATVFDDPPAGRSS